MYKYCTIITAQVLLAKQGAIKIALWQHNHYQALGRFAAKTGLEVQENDTIHRIKNQCQKNLEEYFR